MKDPLWRSMLHWCADLPNLVLSLLLFAVSIPGMAAGIPGIFGEGIIGESSNNVILLNHTGLKIARVLIGDRTYEDTSSREDKIFVSVTPRKHHMELIFRGGVHIDWLNFDFSDVHQITFDLVGNRVSAHPK